MAKQTEHQAQIVAHLSAPATVSYWVTFLLTVMLPMLPSLLLQAAPKLQSAKYQKILKEVDKVLDQLIIDE